MSVRAYRVIEMKLADASFDLFHEVDLVHFFASEGAFLHGASGGMVDVPVAILERAVRRHSKLRLSETTVNRLKQDIAAAKSIGDEAVTYSCF